MRTLLVFALLCASVVADDRVSAPSVAKRDTPVRINHPAGAKVQAIYAVVNGASTTWTYLPDDHFERNETYTVFAAPPGDYLITTGDSTILRIVEEGNPRPEPKPEPPKPEPKPEPEPEPKPEPELDIDWAVWVYEQAEAINQIGQTSTRMSSQTRQFLSSRGIQMAAYDDDQEAAKPFLSSVKGLPSLILLQDEKNYRVYPAPESVDELKKIILGVSGE